MCVLSTAAEHLPPETMPTAVAEAGLQRLETTHTVAVRARVQHPGIITIRVQQEHIQVSLETTRLQEAMPIQEVLGTDQVPTIPVEPGLPHRELLIPIGIPEAPGQGPQGLTETQEAVGPLAV